MSNARFQNALAGEAQAIPPIWFMRQAGRYHRHYQALRAKHSFMELCKQPKLAAEVALGPIRDFDFDVAILFSDLLFPLEAMGMGLSYDPAPTLGWNLTPERLKDLKSPGEALESLRFQKEAMTETRKILAKDKSLIGFVGGPWTLFAYAVEGAHKGGLEASKRNWRLFQPFCRSLVPLLKENIRLQLEGGAEIVMIFDTAAGELSPSLYAESVVPSLDELARAFPGRIGYYAKGVNEAHLHARLFHDPGLFAGLGFDHRWDLGQVLCGRAGLGFTQGAFDQALLFLAPDELREQISRYLKPIRSLSVEQRAGWVSGLGHGVLPATPEENVRLLVKMVRETMA